MNKSFAYLLVGLMLTIGCSIVRAEVTDDDILASYFNKGIAAHGAGDYATALRLARPLAEQGDAEAQLLLGKMYVNGTGVTRDFREAFKWFKLSGEQGDVEASFMLGVSAVSVPKRRAKYAVSISS